MLRIFTPVKIQRLRPGLNPRPWVPEASMLTTRPPKPSCCCVNAVSVKYSECVFLALCIQHAMRMRHICICVCPAVQYFSTLSHKRHDFRKVIKYEKCFDFLYKVCLKHISL